MPGTPETISESSSSAIPAGTDEKCAPARSDGANVLTDRWPALLKAMQDYKREIADDFSALAYRCVTEGIIRFEDRRRLAKAAHRAGIQSFDAQLLIACAIRQWCLDQGRQRRLSQRSTPAIRTHRLQSAWRRWALMAGIAAVLDVALIWHWLS